MGNWTLHFEVLSNSFRTQAQNQIVILHIFFELKMFECVGGGLVFGCSRASQDAKNNRAHQGHTNEAHR